MKSAITTICILVVLGLLTTPAPAQAPAPNIRVEHSSDDLIDAQCRRILNTLPILNGVSTPPLRSTSDIFLIVIAGASYVRIDALALPSTAAAPIAHALGMAVQGTWLGGETVEYSNEAFAVAEIGTFRDHFGVLHSTVKIPIARIVSALKSAGFNPFVVVRVPAFAQVTPHIAPAYQGTEHTLYAGHAVDSIGAISVSASIPLYIVLIMIGIVLIPPAFAAMSVKQGLKAGGKPGLDPATARERYNKAAISPLYGMAPLAMVPLGICAIGPGQPIADLWFATEHLTPLMPLALLPVLSMALSSRVAVNMGAKRFPLPDDATTTIDECADEAQLLRLQRIGDLTSTAGPYLVILGVALPHQSRSALSITCALLGLVAMGVSQVSKAILRRAKRASVDHALTFRAQELARQIDMRIDRVRIDQTTDGLKTCFFEREDADVVISHLLRERATGAEIDFILASAVGMPKARTRWYQQWTAWLMFSPAIVGLYGFYAIARHLAISHGPGLFRALVPTLLVYLIASEATMWLQWKALLRQETAGDTRALTLVDTPEAAVSTLKKLLENPRKERASIFANISVKARLEKRLERLKSEIERTRQSQRTGA